MLNYDHKFIRLIGDENLMITLTSINKEWTSNTTLSDLLAFSVLSIEFQFGDELSNRRFVVVEIFNFRIKTNSPIEGSN